MPDFQVLFESAPGLYLVLTPEFRIVAATNAYLQATMTQRAEILGRGIFEVFPDNPNDSTAKGVQNLRASLRRVLQNRQADAMAVQKYDIRRPESDGGGFEERYWTPVNSPLFGPDNEIVYVIHRVEDVTELVRLKQLEIAQHQATKNLRVRAQHMEADILLRSRELDEANRRLRAANEELGGLYERMKELDVLKTQFFANVSHELRTPLALIIGPLRKRLADRALPSGVRQDLELIDRNARLLLKHVNNLLDLSKLEAGQLVLHYSECDLARLVRLTASYFESLALERQVHYIVDAPKSLDAQVDAEKVQRIVLNLVSNALKFTPIGGTIEVSLRLDRNRAILQVQDSGPGIPAHLREAVFERFRQVDGGTNRQLGGTGLGLSIVKEFVGQHRGLVRLDESPSGGARFTVELPTTAPARSRVAPPTELAEEASEISVWAPETKVRPSQPVRNRPPDDAELILVVEDNLEMSGFLVDLLSEHYLVATAFDGKEGLEKALELRPDLVLTDIMMPRMSGDQLARALRHCAELDDVPVILLTAKADDELRIQLLQECVQDFVNKPFTPEEVLAKVGRLLSDRRRAESKFRVAERRAELSLIERTRLASLSTDVGLALTGSDTLRDMLQRCTDSMVRNLGAALACVWTFSPVEDALELKASAGLITDTDGPHRRVPVGQSEVSLIAHERLPRLNNDIQNYPRAGDQEWARREGIVAFAGYPLLVEDRLVGVMATFSRERLAQATLDVMAAVANQVALGVERKRMEESLRETNRKLQSLVQASPLAIIAYDRDAHVLLWNPAAERIFGWREAEALNRPALHVSAGQRAEFLALLEGEMNGETRAALELSYQRKDGSLVEMSRWNAPLYDCDGTITASLCFHTDNTEHRCLEEQLRHAQKMEAVGRLAGGLAHDFNNLLTVITGYSDVLMENLRPEDPWRELVDQIHKAGERASALTRQLLAFSRKQVLTPVTLDLNALIANLEKMLARLIGEDVDFCVSVEPYLWSVRADSGQIEQVLMNLVVNARDAMPHGGTLTIETRNVELDNYYAARHPDAKPGQHVLLAVCDTGCGMDKATMARIFEPFFTTKTPDKGTGLGLATVYGIIKQSGGHVEVISEPAAGTTFKIYLPRDKDSHSVQKASPLSASVQRGSETILLVEDEQGVRSFARFVLTRLGYNVLEARNGGEALLTCEQYQGKIHLMVTDLVMPQMNGRLLAERLAPLRPEMRVLYMSGYTDDEVLRLGILDSGTTSFLQKPFSPERLARKVRDVLDTARARDASE